MPRFLRRLAERLDAVELAKLQLFSQRALDGDAAGHDRKLFFWIGYPPADLFIDGSQTRFQRYKSGARPLACAKKPHP